MLINFAQVVKKYNLKVENVLHVGAHNAVEYNDYVRFGAKRIHWVEANKDTCGDLKRRLNKNINLITCAVVSDKDDDEVTFNITNNLQSSSILDLGVHKNLFPSIKYVKKEIRKTTTIDTIMADSNIVGDVDLLSMDIQGAELLALKGATQTLQRTKAIIMEYNEVEVYVGCGVITEVDDYLAPFGFKRVETGRYKDHPWGDTLFVKS